MRLVEREVELAELAAAIGDAEGGVGGVLLVRGPAGIGKTSLVTAAAEHARARGMLVFGARAIDLEQSFTFGVVRQLLERHVRAQPALLGEGAAGLAAPALGIDREGVRPDLFGILHGLYWLVSEIAADSGLLLWVDDVQWSDDASLRFLAYIAHRVSDLRVAVVLAERTGELTAQATATIEREPSTRVLLPRALTTAGTAQVTTSELGRELSPKIVDAIQTGTAGNPFLLHELLADARSNAIAIDVSEQWIRELTPTAVSRSILIRLGRLGHGAGRLAEAVAILGDGARLDEAAALAELELEEGGRAAVALTRADILADEPELGYAHPLVRAAVYGDIPPAGRAARHLTAARMLLAAGHKPDRIAAQLLLAPPAGEIALADTLRSAARAATARSESAVAVRHLRRALDELPAHPDRAGILAELGGAELASGDPAAAAAHLTESVERAASDQELTLRVRVLAQATAQTEGSAAAVDLLDHFAARLGHADPELSLSLQADAAFLSYLDPSASEKAGERLIDWEGLPGDTPAQRMVLAFSAGHLAWRGGPAATVLDLVARAHRTGELWSEQGVENPVVHFSLLGAVTADGVELALREETRAIEDARRRGSANGFVYASVLRSLAALRAGDLGTALSDAVAAHQAAAELDLSPIRDRAVATSAAAPIIPLLEQGDLAGAREALAACGLGEATVTADDAPMAAILQYRCAVRLAEGRAREALTDAELCGHHQELLSINDLLTPWRLLAATAHGQLGEVERGRELALDHLALAEAWGAPSIIGETWLTLGTIEPGPERIEQLTRAIDALAQSPAILLLARARIELGTAHRQHGDRVMAREQLTEGADLAMACGAVALQQRALDELRVLGARPRKLAFSGVDSLTASERRVAEMAAAGMANREIAQALFVTAKTVESHLGRAYRKLGIDSKALGALSRAKLAAELGEASAAA